MTDYNNGAVVRIDTESNRIAAVIPVGAEAWHIASSEHAIWVAVVEGRNRFSAPVFGIIRIDPATNAVVDHRVAGTELSGLAVSADDTVWGISSTIKAVEWFR